MAQMGITLFHQGIALILNDCFNGGEAVRDFS
jgi:hypothetical protein